MLVADDLLNKLPDQERAKIANTLLDDVRNRFGSKRVALAANALPLNLAVDFWRVSSTEQRDGYSLEAQESKAVEYKEAAGLKSVKSWAVSESASKEFDRRKFFAMISFVVEHGVKNVVFDRIDRACRGLRAAVLIEDLIEAGVCFHFVRDNLVVDKHSSPSEKLRFYLGVVLAKWYIDNLKIEIKKGLDTRLAEGYFNARAPVGYINVRPKFGKANLAVHEGVGKFISECFELYKTGNYSRLALAKLGLERGVCWTTETRVCDANGNSKVVVKEKHVTDKMLERALANPLYCQGRRVDGKVIKVKNAQWPALTSYETFMACQKMQGMRARQNSQIRYEDTVSIPKPLMQLLKCRECNHAVTGRVKRKASGKRYVYYHCAYRHCAQSNINTSQRELFRQFAAAFEPFARFPPETTTRLLRTIKARVQDSGLCSLNQLSGKPAAVGLNLIELLQNARDYMNLDGFELEKARLLKAMLSNPTLKDKTIAFNYRKPFNDLLLFDRNNSERCG